MATDFMANIIFIIIYFVGKKVLINYNNYIIKKAQSSMKIPTNTDHV